MTRKFAALLSVAALLISLTGCTDSLPRAREMGDMALMRTMGVDAGDKADDYLVTVSSSRRARGVQGEEEPPLVLSAQRPSISGACLAMQSLSESSVFYGHVDQLLLGEELARQGVLEALAHFSQDKELGMGAQVWLLHENTAQAAIQSQKETGVDNRLKILQTDGEQGMAGVSRTVSETLTSLLEDGSAYLPALELKEGEDQNALLEYGYAVLRDGVLAGYLTGPQARGLELAQGHGNAELLELEGASVRLEDAELTCVPVFKEDILTALTLDLRLTAQVAEEHGEGMDRETLREQIQILERTRLQSALEQLQRWNADCLGLARVAGSAQPEQWERIREQWPERFPELEIEIRCTALLT